MKPEKDIWKKTAKEKGRNFLLFNAMGKQKQKKNMFPQDVHRFWCDCYRAIGCNSLEIAL